MSKARSKQERKGLYERQPVLTEHAGPLGVVFTSFLPCFTVSTLTGFPSVTWTSYLRATYSKIDETSGLLLPLVSSSHRAHPASYPCEA